MIAKALFGRTGHLSTRTLFGAAALGNVTQKESDKTMDMLMEWGINHIDTAASYGEAELRLGPWLAQHRDKVFLATKTENRTYQGAKEELHRSLEKMQVDSVDLWQMHVLVKEDEWQTAMAPGGALEAFIEAKEQGLVRFLGVTGHGLDVAKMHMRSLEKYDFDSVLLPYNYPMMQNPQYAADLKQLHQICLDKNVAFQMIKTITRGPWGDKPRNRACWYEPLEEQTDIDRAVNWALSLEGSFLNTVGDIYLLPRVLEAASRFSGQKPSEAEMQAMLEQKEMAPLFV